MEVGHLILKFDETSGTLDVMRVHVLGHMNTPGVSGSGVNTGSV